MCSGRYTARIRGKRVIREFAGGEFADGAKIRRSLDAPHYAGGKGVRLEVMDYFEHGLGRSLWRAALTARSPRIKATRKDASQGERCTMVRFLSFRPRDQPYFGEMHFHSSRATPCSRASQSTNCFQISAPGPRALVISADEGFSVLSISAFGVIELFLTSKQR